MSIPFAGVERATFRATSPTFELLAAMSSRSQVLGAHLGLPPSLPILRLNSAKVVLKSEVLC